MSTPMIIQPEPPGVRRADEARKARHRLYPVTALYTLCCAILLSYALASPHPGRALLFFALGFLVWTWVEYHAHRYVLHGRFPDGPGLWQHFLHKSFDHLHWEHHARPWDGNHVNGTLKDTGHIFAVFFAVSFLAPPHTLSILVAGVLQAYICEEWVHHSVHFCSFRSKYFRYIKRHHLYHHSPKGSDVGYGLTSGLWDVMYQTRIPAPIREKLYSSSRTAA